MTARDEDGVGVSVSPPSSRFRSNRAVVIGIDAYQGGVPPLRNAVRDALEIGRRFGTDHGFMVDALFDCEATRENLHALLADRLSPALSGDDRLLVFFAGHGVSLPSDDGRPEGYLLLHDAVRDDPSSFLRMSELHDAFEQLACRHFLLILDCCFAGTFRWASQRDIAGAPVVYVERYDHFVASPSWQVLTSSGSDQKALDALADDRGAVGGAGHSPFAMALIDGLQGHADLDDDGLVTATELYLFARKRVERGARRMVQTPGLFPLRRHEHGEFVLQVPGSRLRLRPAPELVASRNPYRDLASYDEADARTFFGRDAAIASLIERVELPLIVVVGASGSGKSSLVKAGLIPALRRRGTWNLVPPRRPGTSPLAALRTFAQAMRGSVDATEGDALDAWRAAIRSLPADRPTLVVIDQFEELSTLGHDSDDVRAFQDALAEGLRTAPGLHVVVTIRSDVEPRFQDGPLADWWPAGRVPVQPMTRAELRSAIVGPADEVVMTFEPATLVDRLIDDVSTLPAPLPLLSFTLSELYRAYWKRLGADAGVRDRALRETDYVALGSVASALTRRAGEVYASVATDPSAASTVRNLMMRMVVTLGGTVMRRRTPLLELDYPDEAENRRVAVVLERFAAARLVAMGTEQAGAGGAAVPYVEPAHDELVRGWDRMAGWLEATTEARALLRPLAIDVEVWQSAGRLTSYLWHGDPRLPQAVQLLRSPERPLNRRETEFVEHSHLRFQRLRRRWTVGGALTTLGFASLAVYAFLQADNANRQTDLAIAARDRAVRAEDLAKSNERRATEAADRERAAADRERAAADRERVARQLAVDNQNKATAERDRAESQRRITQAELGLQVGGDAGAVMVIDAATSAGGGRDAELAPEIGDALLAVAFSAVVPIRVPWNAALSPDGAWLADGNARGVHLYRADTGRLERTVNSGPAQNAMFIDSARLRVGRDWVVDRWSLLDLSDGSDRELPRLTRGDHGLGLVTGGDIGTARSPVLDLEDSGGVALEHAKVSPDGVAYSVDPVRLWSVSSGKAIAFDHAASSGRWQTGQLLGSARHHILVSGPELAIFDTRDGRLVARLAQADGCPALPVQGPFARSPFVESPGGELLAARCPDGRTVQVWRTDSGARGCTIQLRAPTDLEFSPDSSLLLASGDEVAITAVTGCVTTAQLRTTGAARFIGDSGHVLVIEPGRMNLYALGPTGLHLAAAIPPALVEPIQTVRDGPIVVVNGGRMYWPLRDRLAHRIENSADPDGRQTFSPDGARVLLRRDDGAVVVDTRTSRVIARLDGQVFGAAAVFAADGNTVIVETTPGRPAAFSATSGALLRRFEASPEARGALHKIGIVRDGQVVLGDEDPTSVTWRFDTGALLASWDEYAIYLPERTVSRQRDGRLEPLTAAKLGRPAGAAETATLLSIIGRDGWLYEHASGDGRVVASIDRNLVLVDLSPADRSRVFRDPNSVAQVEAIAVSRDGRWIATAQDDAIHLWDVQRELRIASYPGLSEVRELAFTASGDALLVSARQAAYVIRLTPADLIAFACRIVVQADPDGALRRDPDMHARAVQQCRERGQR